MEPLNQAATETEVDRQLLAHFAPAAAVVRHTGEVVRLYGSLDRYVRLPGGSAPLDLRAFVRRALKPALDSALHKALHRHYETVVETLHVRRRGHRATLRITVERVNRTKPGEKLWLVIFEESPLLALEESERELQTAREQMALDLRRMTRWHEASTRIGGPGDLHEALEEILRAAVEITEAEMGYIQRLDDTGVLAIAAQTGFEPPFEYFASGTEMDPAGYSAMTSNQRVTVADVTESPTLAGSTFLDVLTGAGVRALQSTPLFDRSGAFLGTLSTHYRVRHEFNSAEQRWLDLLARHAGDLIQRFLTEVRLRTTSELERRVAERTQLLRLVHAVTSAINEAPNWVDGLQAVLRRICETAGWQAAYVYLPDRDDPNVIVPVISCLGDERLRPFHAAAEQSRFTSGQSMAGRVFATGLPEWVNGREALLDALPMRRAEAQLVGLEAAIALPIRSGQDVIAVIELFSDQPQAPSDLLSNLMNDIGAQIANVLERERMTAKMADLVWEEQQKLLHTLHDSLGQTLTGLGMLASGLSPATGSWFEVATKIRELSQQALEQVRQLSKGLFPVEVDHDGLVRALRELASTTESFHPIHVTVEGDDPAPIPSCLVATQLYRIAQEAVTNAVKHARADGIDIALHQHAGVTRLRVSDNGVGITEAPAKGQRLGLRIMNYRATSIGATLSIESGPGGGTIVTCTLRQSTSVAPPRSPGGTPAAGNPSHKSAP